MEGGKGEPVPVVGRILYLLREVRKIVLPVKVGNKEPVPVERGKKKPVTC